LAGGQKWLLAGMFENRLGPCGPSLFHLQCVRAAFLSGDERQIMTYSYNGPETDN